MTAATSRPSPQSLLARGRSPASPASAALQSSSSPSAWATPWPPPRLSSSDQASPLYGQLPGCSPYPWVHPRRPHHPFRRLASRPRALVWLFLPPALVRLLVSARPALLPV